MVGINLVSTWVVAVVTYNTDLPARALLCFPTNTHPISHYSLLHLAQGKRNVMHLFLCNYKEKLEIFSKSFA